MKTPEQLSLEDAQKIAEESDYAFAASETDCNPINWGDAAAFVLEGYKACFTELTRWNDPRKELPENNNCILIKAADELGNEAIYLGSREGNDYLTDNGLTLATEFDDRSTPDMNVRVIGWREIL